MLEHARVSYELSLTGPARSPHAAPYKRVMVRARLQALDQLRGHLDILMLCQELLTALRSDRPGLEQKYRAALATAAVIKRIVHATRSTGTTAQRLARVLRTGAPLSHASLIGPHWRLTEELLRIQSALRARSLTQLEELLREYHPDDANNVSCRRMQAATNLHALSRPQGAGGLAHQLKGLLEQPTWAGPYRDVLSMVRAIPHYVLSEYITETREQRLILLRGTPQAAQELWALYGQRCAPNAKTCRPGLGHFELEYADEARGELETFQHRTLASLPLTTEVRVRLLERWHKLLHRPAHRVAEKLITRLRSTASGLEVLRIIKRVQPSVSDADAVALLRARLLGQLFRAADDAQVAYVATRPLTKTIRANQAVEIIRRNLKQLGLPLRSSRQPVAAGWSVETSPLASAQAVVRPEQRLVLVQSLPGDPPIFSREDLYLDFGLHELSHILRSEAGRRGPFAILATGVRGYLDYEEGFASLLERLSVFERRTERRTTHALGYYAAHLALQNAPPRLIKPRFSWQDVYDLCSQYGMSEPELYETVRRLIRMTDGKRRPRNINLRDAVYYRGIREIETWLMRTFGEHLERRLAVTKSRGTISRPIRMLAAHNRREQLAAQAVLEVFNQLMVGKVTPAFASELRRNGHTEPPAYLLSVRNDTRNDT